jgi:hypothetical protein
MNNILRSIILFIILLYVVYIAYSCNNTENFSNTADNYTYVNDNILNIESKPSYPISDSVLVNIIDYMKKYNKISREVIPINTNKFKLLIDPYISKYILNNEITVQGVYKEGIFVCLSHTRLGVEDCIWDFRGKTVAYIYMSDFLFIQAIAKAYRQDIEKIRLRKIKLEDLKYIDKQFDYFFTYAVIGSEYMNVLKYSRYYINGLNDFDISRLKVFYPVIEYNRNTIQYYFNKYDDDTSYNIFLSNKKSLIPIMRYDIIQNIETFITRLELPKDYLENIGRNYDNNSDEFVDGSYSCYGNKNITSKFECDSYYTKEGKVKNYYSIWDKKCSTNEDCPYYKANTKYDNDRGGCINGYCEFPVGVKRIGFTKYNNEEYNQPFCYECKDTSDLNCCTLIENIKKNSKENAYNNDYVFENDTEDRIKNNLNTIISLLDYRSI